MKGRTAHNYKNPNLVPQAVADLIREQAREIRLLTTQRDELLAALHKIKKSGADIFSVSVGVPIAAIAKPEAGGAPKHNESTTEKHGAVSLHSSKRRGRKAQGIAGKSGSGI